MKSIRTLKKDLCTEKKLKAPLDLILDSIHISYMPRNSIAKLNAKSKLNPRSNHVINYFLRRN